MGGQLLGEEWRDGHWIESEEWGGWHEGWKGPFHGWLYGDGSCDSSPVGELKRAASAVVQVSEDGHAVRRLTATVPNSWPQTSQSSEYLAAALAVRFANGDFTFVGDCKGVTVDMTSTPARMLAASKKYAGVLMDTLAWPAKRRQLKEVQWMPSHRTLDDDADEEKRRNHEGNRCADEGAKASRGRHPTTDFQAEKEIEFYLKRAALVAKAIAVAMARFPPRGERLLRQGNERGDKAREAGPAHQWIFADGAWRCHECGSWRQGGESAARVQGGRCNGWVSRTRLKRVAAFGHRLHRAEGDQGIVFCSRCGASATRRPRKLLRPCVSPTVAGKQALKRIERGFMPWQLRAGSKRWHTRGRIRCVAKLESHTLKWMLRRRGGLGRLRMGAAGEKGKGKDRGIEADRYPSPEAGAQEFLEGQEECHADQMMEEWELAWQAKEQEIMDAEWQAAAEDGLIDDMNPREEASSTPRGQAPLAGSQDSREVEGKLKVLVGKATCGGSVRDRAYADREGTARKRRKSEVTAAKKAEARSIEDEAIAAIAAKLTKRPHDGADRLERVRRRVSERAKQNEGLGGGNDSKCPAKGSAQVRAAKCIQQPGDGNCLYHALVWGWEGSSDVIRARHLRRDIAKYMAEHPTVLVSGITLGQWVQEESGAPVASYAARMSRRGWGGELEMVVFAVMRRCTVKVFRRAELGEEGTGALEDGSALVENAQYGREHADGRVLSVLFEGGVHYNALTWDTVTSEGQAEGGKQVQGSAGAEATKLQEARRRLGIFDNCSGVTGVKRKTRRDRSEEPRQKKKKASRTLATVDSQDGDLFAGAARSVSSMMHERVATMPSEPLEMVRRRIRGKRSEP